MPLKVGNGGMLSSLHALFVSILLEKQRLREVFHPPVYFLNSQISWKQARPKAGAQDPIRVSHPRTGPLPPRVHVSRKLALIQVQAPRMVGEPLCRNAHPTSSTSGTEW